MQGNARQGGEAGQGKRWVCKARQEKGGVGKAREVKAKIGKGIVCKAGKAWVGKARQRNFNLETKEKKTVARFHIQVEG